MQAPSPGWRTQNNKRLSGDTCTSFITFRFKDQFICTSQRDLQPQSTPLQGRSGSSSLHFGKMKHFSSLNPGYCPTPFPSQGLGRLPPWSEVPSATSQGAMKTDLIPALSIQVLSSLVSSLILSSFSSLQLPPPPQVNQARA